MYQKCFLEFRSGDTCENSKSKRVKRSSSLLIANDYQIKSLFKKSQRYTFQKYTELTNLSINHLLIMFRGIIF